MTKISFVLIKNVNVWVLHIYLITVIEDDKSTEGITFSSQSGPAWADSERDYTYDEVWSWFIWWVLSLFFYITHHSTQCLWHRFPLIHYIIYLSASIQLLSRVFNIMREKNPDMVAGEKRKFVMKPPQVVRVGTKKTSFVNFTDICKLWVQTLSMSAESGF